jgi:hypothetical protein
MSNPERKLKACLDWRHRDAEVSAQVSVNAVALIEGCNQARRTMFEEVGKEIMPCLEPRQVQLEGQSGIQILPESWYDVKPEPIYTLPEALDFSVLTVADVEVKLLALCDEINTQMEDYYWDIDAWISEAEKTMRWMIDWTQMKLKARFKSFMRYVLVALLMFVHVGICWGEICLIPT